MSAAHDHDHGHSHTHEASSGVLTEIDHVGIAVSDLDAAVEFYATLFATPPAKVRPGYANFAVADPPLKLVLIAGTGAPGTLNHLGVEVESADEVQAA